MEQIVNRYIVMISHNSVRVHRVYSGLEALTLTEADLKAHERLCTIGSFGSYAGYVVEAVSESMAILEAGKKLGEDEADHADREARRLAACNYGAEE
jgi:hypothetical protein